MDEVMQEQVYKLLLKPISCSKKYQTIASVNDIIQSGQRYYCSADEDMSDFAIGFYEILYRDILDGKALLNKQNKLSNTAFAGDTMNSFNAIANMTPSAGSSKAKRTPENAWPKYLSSYYRGYHCLANFWIISSDIGRKGKKLNSFDSMDLFMCSLKESESLLPLGSDYANAVGDFEHFCKIHFVAYCSEKMLIKQKYKGKDSEYIVNLAMENIRERSKRISISPYSADLWAYFH